jgi:hypothetical protein
MGIFSNTLKRVAQAVNKQAQDYNSQIQTGVKGIGSAIRNQVKTLGKDTISGFKGLHKAIRRNLFGN